MSANACIVVLEVPSVSNILNTDQASFFGPDLGPNCLQRLKGQNIGPDLVSKLFDTLMIFMKEFFEKVNFEQNHKTTKNHRKIF